MPSIQLLGSLWVCVFVLIILCDSAGYSQDRILKNLQTYIMFSMLSFLMKLI